MEHDYRHPRSLLQEKIQELMRTKEELNRAKEEATQSWLDSRPLIDELERFKQELEDAEKQPSVTLSALPELEAELLAINKAIKMKKEEELEASNMINETTLAIDRTRDELEELKAGNNKEHRIRSRQKQTLRLKRQRLRYLQLGLRAVRIESEAVGAFEVWRISVAEEQKLVAGDSRKKAIVRLKEAQSKKRYKKEKKKGLEDEQKEGERRSRSEKGKGLADEEIEGEKGFKGMKEKEFADEETDGEKGYWGVKKKGLEEYKENKRFKRAKYEGLVDEESEAETAEAGDLSSLGNEPVNNRPFASARTPTQKIYGSNITRQLHASRSSSGRFTGSMMKDIAILYHFPEQMRI